MPARRARALELVEVRHSRVQPLHQRARLLRHDALADGGGRGLGLTAPAGDGVDGGVGGANERGLSFDRFDSVRPVS